MTDYLVQHMGPSGVLEYIVDEDGYEELRDRMPCIPIPIKNRKGEYGEIWFSGDDTLMLLPLKEEEHEPTTDRQEKTKPITLREGKGQKALPPSQRPTATG